MAKTIWIVVIFTSLLCAILAISQKTSFATVLSPSMSPKIEAGDTVITKAKARSEVKIGDVLLLPYPDAPESRFVHRLINVTSGRDSILVSTKGDANPIADPWQLEISSPQVRAVVGVLPTSLLLKIPFARPVIMAMLLVLALTLLIRAWLLSAKQSRDNIS